MAQRHYRAFERRSINLPVRLTLAANNHVDGRLLNLGLGGAALHFGTYINVGTKVKLELEAANLWDPLCVDARIAWVRETSNGFLAGIAFEHESARTVGSLLGLLTAGAYS